MNTRKKGPRLPVYETGVLLSLIVPGITVISWRLLQAVYGTVGLTGVILADITAYAAGLLLVKARSRRGGAETATTISAVLLGLGALLGGLTAGSGSLPLLAGSQVLLSAGGGGLAAGAASVLGKSGRSRSRMDGVVSAMSAASLLLGLGVGTMLLVNARAALPGAVSTSLSQAVALETLPYAEEVEKDIRVLLNNSDTAAIMQDVVLPDPDTFAAFHFDTSDIMVTVPTGFLAPLGDGAASELTKLVREAAAVQLHSELPELLATRQEILQAADSGVETALDKVCTSVSALEEMGQDADCTCILVYGEEMVLYQEQLDTLREHMRLMGQALPAALSDAAEAYVSGIGETEVAAVLLSAYAGGFRIVGLVLAGLSAVLLTGTILDKRRDRISK